jgi:PEP-CTERM motif
LTSKEGCEKRPTLSPGIHPGRLPMRKFLWATLAILAIAISAPYASADTIESFKFSGTLKNSFMGKNSVTGTFTLDLTRRTITAFDFTTPVTAVNGGNGWYASIHTFTPAVKPKIDFVELRFQDRFGDYLYLWFQTDLASFSGSTFFTGPVIPDRFDFGISDIEVYRHYFESIYTNGRATYVGSATPVTTAPEPASLLLLGSGLLGLAGIKRRRSGC